MSQFSRRTFIKSTAVAFTATSCSSDESIENQIIDTHTHFYDPTRPQGIPWPSKKSRLYRKVMPQDYVKLTKPQGITGTVIVEASNWLEDNQWIIDLAVKEKVVVGVVGQLNPGTSDFEKSFSRFKSQEYFRGVRVRRDILEKVNDKTVAKHFSMLAENDLSVDVLGGAQTLDGVIEVAQKFPELRININHLPKSCIRVGKVNSEILQKLKKASSLPNVYAKVSDILEKDSSKKTIESPEYYEKSLDLMWNLFGPERVIYGSNWPVMSEFSRMFYILDQYTQKLSKLDRQRYFWRNAKEFYKYIDQR
ncbi:MAG: amidohydrolase family protein [Lentisphaeraceae bacterium]|nr:amidohydrolase family protein [Lentisphaeraceae bacterium]